MSTAIAQVEQSQAVASATNSVVQMTNAETLFGAIMRAAEGFGDFERAERMLAFYERLKASEAKATFDAAFSAAKAEIKPVIKNKAIEHGNKRIATYANMAAISDAIDPILARHDLGYSFEPDVLADGQIVVTCIISHPSGHEKRTRIPAPRDKTGAKNEIQSIGSTLTYLSRYALCLALGIATKDDDGAMAGAGILISADDAAALREKLAIAGLSEERWSTRMSVESVDVLPASRYDEGERRIMDFVNAKAQRDAR